MVDQASALEPHYPFKSHFLEIDGHRMHYVDEGTGPVVVMLHGNPTWSFYYRHLISGLSDRFRVIAPDHIGCGLSEKPRVYPYTLATHIDNVDRLLEHLEVSDVTLAVHDWGGAIGFGWAMRRPQRVKRFVVFNTAAFLEGRTPLRIRLCGWPIVGEVLVRGFNAFARSALHMASKVPGRMTPEIRRGYLMPYDSYGHRVAILRFVRDIPSTTLARESKLRPASRLRQWRQRLAGALGLRPKTGGNPGSFQNPTVREGPLGRTLSSLNPQSHNLHRTAKPSIPSHKILQEIEEALPGFADRPMIIFWGMRDFCFHEGFLDGWTRRFPDAEVHRFADAGHYVVEDAHERILPLLRAFLEKTDAAT